jgi:hypothetical protein
MKNRILLFASLLISTFTIAQSKPSFGIRAGGISSSISGNAMDNFKDMLEFANGMITTNDRQGFFVGGFVNIPVGSTMSIEPALYYSQKGYEMKGEFNVKGFEFIGANAKAQLRSQYIDLPVLIKANLNGFQLFAGPQVSYLSQADLRTTAGVLGFNLLNKTMNATDNLNRWDVAATGGVGYQFNNGLNIMALYDHGLSRVDANQNMESYNKAVKVGLGFRF